MGTDEINAYWRKNSRYYREPRSPEDVAEQTRLYEYAQTVGKWEKAHRIPDIKRLTWWYSDFGSFVPKEYLTPEQLTARHNEIIEINQKEAQGKMSNFPSKEAVERLREQYPVGTRIELISMSDPYSTLKPGDQGAVSVIDDTGTIFLDWDSGSTLGLVYGVDSFKRAEAPVYENGADFWNGLKQTSVSLEAAAETGGKYIGAMMKHECSDKIKQFCRELFAAMYEDTAGKTDPAKLVYPYNLQKANERTEESAYYDNYTLNTECARAIDSTINGSRYKRDFYNLELAAMKAVHDFGFARVNQVLAHNFQQREYDGRFSSANKEWARQFSNTDRAFDDSFLQAHPILINSFTEYARKLYDAAHAERFARPGLPESGEVIHGYEITRSIAFDNERGFAIGHNPDAPSKFVCWQFTVENGKREFYWGNYGGEKTAADNYITRVMVHMNDYGVKEIQPPQAVLEAAAQGEKPSVIGQIRDAQKAPKPPRKEKRRSSAIKRVISTCTIGG